MFSLKCRLNDGRGRSSERNSHLLPGSVAAEGGASRREGDGALLAKHFVGGTTGGPKAPSGSAVGA